MRRHKYFISRHFPLASPCTTPSPAMPPERPTQDQNEPPRRAAPRARTTRGKRSQCSYRSQKRALKNKIIISRATLRGQSGGKKGTLRGQEGAPAQGRPRRRRQPGHASHRHHRIGPAIARHHRHRPPRQQTKKPNRHPAREERKRPAPLEFLGQQTQATAGSSCLLTGKSTESAP